MVRGLETADKSGLNNSGLRVVGLFKQCTFLPTPSHSCNTQYGNSSFLNLFNPLKSCTNDTDLSDPHYVVKGWPYCRYFLSTFVQRNETLLFQLHGVVFQWYCYVSQSQEFSPVLWWVFYAHIIKAVCPGLAQTGRERAEHVHSEHPSFIAQDLNWLLKDIFFSKMPYFSFFV